jgi:predicted nucleic acid-binding protein
MKFTKLFGLLQILGSIMTGENIVIILSIISIVVAIIFGMPAVKTWRFEKKKDELKQKLLFKEGGWLNASQLTYSSLDFIRVMKDEQKPTSQAGIIESIRDIIDKRKEKEEQNHILLVGPSLSGKSHITVSVLKSLDDAYVLIPNEDTFNQSTKDGYELPDAPANARYKIILLDNFHEFFKGSASTPKALIHEAIDKGFTLWANCISVEEYARVNSYLDFKDGYLGLFTEIDLCKRITSEEATIIAKGLGIEILPASFNGIIGEIFYRPSDMIQHYEELKSDVVALDVLIFIKQTYILGAFTSPYLIRLELLKQAFTKKYSPDFITLMSALKKIEQKGFIKLLNDHTYISFESVWLNEIVEPEMRASEFFSFWKDIIPRNNYETALERYDKIEKGKADVIVYNSIISKSPNYETAVEWYNKIENGKADVFTYNPIISKSPNYETALEWYRKIEKGTENAITYSSLITKSPNYKTALEWYNKIEKGAATTITYNSLIDKSPNYNAALEWYNKIEKGSATTITYNSLISKSPNFETALEWYSKIEKGDETTITYNSLIDKSPNYETAVEWYNKIEDDKANVFTCTLLIGKSPNYETALQWSNKIEKGQANVFTYSTLIGKSPNYETALKWFSKIEIGTATTNAYNCLISKCPNYETAIEWYNKIENGQADLFTFNCLISKCPLGNLGYKQVGLSSFSIIFSLWIFRFLIQTKYL